MDKPELISLSFSPWSIMARWALDIRKVTYHRREYLPMLGEPLLRARLKAWSGRVTVPVLLLEDHALRDSYEIALYARRVGRGPTLVPDGRDAEVEAWNQRCQRAMEAGRALTTAKVAESPAALVESVPPFMRAVRPLAAAMGRSGAAFLTRKYHLTPGVSNEHEATLRDFLLSVREAIEAGDGFILGEFSYADIAAATAMQFIDPVADGFVRLGPASRACWRRDGLAEDFADVLAWRDEIFNEHHPRRFKAAVAAAS